MGGREDGKGKKIDGKGIEGKIDQKRSRGREGIGKRGGKENEEGEEGMGRWGYIRRGL